MVRNLVECVAYKYECARVSVGCDSTVSVVPVGDEDTWVLEIPTSPVRPVRPSFPSRPSRLSAMFVVYSFVLVLHLQCPV